MPCLPALAVHRNPTPVLYDTSPAQPVARQGGWHRYGVAGALRRRRRLIAEDIEIAIEAAEERGHGHCSASPTATSSPGRISPPELLDQRSQVTPE